MMPLFRADTKAEAKAKRRLHLTRLKCWVARTPYQVGLLLILCVGIPFLLSMVIVYLIYGLGGGSQLCADLCMALVNKSDMSYKRLHVPVYTGISPMAGWGLGHREEAMKEQAEGFLGPVDGLMVNFGEIFEIENPKTEVPPEQVHHEQKDLRARRSVQNSDCVKSPIKSRFPAIGALIENIHVDDDSQKMYTCMAVLISDNIALTSSYCLSAYTRGYETSFRLNSNFWSKEGFLAQITGASAFLLNSAKAFKNELVAIRFKEQTKKHCFEDAFQLGFVNKSVKIGLAFTWNSNLNLPLKKRKKFAPLKSYPVMVHEKKYGDILVGVSREVDCSKDFGGPLLSADGRFLFGIHLYSKCMRGFVENYYANLAMVVEKYMED